MSVVGKYVIIAIGVVCLVSGCTAHVVQTRIADTAGIKEVSTSSDFALSTDDPVTTTNVDDCPTDLIQRVKIKQSFGQKIISLFTLGLHDSVTIEVTCKNAPTTIASTEE